MIFFQYPEDMFFDAWAQITERYRNNPWVAGPDLRNEIRPVSRVEPWFEGREGGA